MCIYWARLWGVRQFAFIGQPPIGECRELRRLRDPVADKDLEGIRAAADAGNYAAYQRQRRSLPIRLEKRPDLRLNAYGEPREPRIIGVRLNDLVIETRSSTWTIDWHARQIAGPWTCDNICTQFFQDADGRSAVVDAARPPQQRKQPHTPMQADLGNDLLRSQPWP